MGSGQVIESSPWHAMTHIVLRSPGFAFDDISRLCFTKSVMVAQRLLTAHAQKRQMQSFFEAHIFPLLSEEPAIAGGDKTARQFWYKLRQRIRHGQSFAQEIVEAACARCSQPALATGLSAWQALCNEIEQLDFEGEATFVSEMSDKRRTLYALATESRFEEAIWLSSPTVYDIGLSRYKRYWDPQYRSAKVKRLERVIYAYLQRFCTKNETMSFFGPINYAMFDLTLSSGVSYRRASMDIQQRRIFFAYWGAVALANAIAADPQIRPFLSPRRNPTRRGYPKGEDTASLLDSINGDHSVLDIAAHLSLPSNEVLELIERLVVSGWVHLGFAIPPAILDPLDDLAAHLQALPASASRDRWVSVLSKFQRDCADFAKSDFAARREILRRVELRFTEITHLDARRGQGQVFQDRSLIYEECHGAIDELRLSKQHQERLQRCVEPIAALCATYSQLLLDDLRAISEALFNELSPKGDPIPFIRLLAAWWRRDGLSHMPSAADEFKRQFADLVAHHSDGRVSGITSEEILALCKPTSDAMFMSPDLMLAATNLNALAEGDYQVGVGEIHHGVQGAGLWLSFVADYALWESDLIARLPAVTSDMTPANLLFQRMMKIAPPEFPGPSVQVSGFSRSSQRMDVGNLMVERHNGRLFLRGPGEQRFLKFYPPSFGFSASTWETHHPFASFSFPIVQMPMLHLDGHTPRIEIGGTVYQRERWDIATTQIPAGKQGESSFQILVQFLMFKQKYSLPDHVFVHSEVESKPVYINFHNFFALEFLIHLAAKVQVLGFVEMWPGPEHLWLTGPEGCYCCEFRTVLSNVTVQP